MADHMLWLEVVQDSKQSQHFEPHPWHGETLRLILIHQETVAEVHSQLWDYGLGSLLFLFSWHDMQPKIHVDLELDCLHFLCHFIVTPPIFLSHCLCNESAVWFGETLHLRNGRFVSYCWDDWHKSVAVWHVVNLFVRLNGMNHVHRLLSGYGQYYKPLM